MRRNQRSQRHKDVASLQREVNVSQRWLPLKDGFHLSEMYVFLFEASFTSLLCLPIYHKLWIFPVGFNLNKYVSKIDFIYFMTRYRFVQVF